MNSSNKEALKKYFQIDDQDYKELNIVLLLNKKKNSKNYNGHLEIYGNPIEIEGRLTGDYVCLIFANKKDSKDIVSQNLTSDVIYSKRLSGILNSMKLYLGANKMFARREQNTKNADGLYCSFKNDDVIINFICYDGYPTELDKSMLQMLDQLIYKAQVESEQLLTLKFNTKQQAIWENNEILNIDEAINRLLIKYKSGRYKKASYDLLNSREFYFDFEVSDKKIPIGFEKHFIITGPVKNTSVFSKLNYLTSQINKSKKANE